MNIIHLKRVWRYQKG